MKNYQKPSASFISLVVDDIITSDLDPSMGTKPSPFDYEDGAEIE